MIGGLFKKTKKFKSEYENTRGFLEEFRKENEQKWLAIEKHYAEEMRKEAPVVEFNLKERVNECIIKTINCKEK